MKPYQYIVKFAIDNGFSLQVRRVKAVGLQPMNVIRSDDYDKIIEEIKKLDQAAITIYDNDQIVGWLIINLLQDDLLDAFDLDKMLELVNQQQ